MLGNYKIITVTHKGINLKHIKDYVVKTTSSESMPARLSELKSAFGLEELLYMATCNRVMYFFVTSSELDEGFAKKFFKAVNPDLPSSAIDKVKDHAFFFTGMEAIAHLYDVAASIDSLVIGERQILGQLREAYDQCHAWGLTGDHLRLAVQQAIVAAKGVYSQTRIGEKPVSIVSLAIQRMLSAHIRPQDRILMIGAGQTNQLVAKILAKHQFESVTIANRTFGKAQELAATLGGKALPMSELQNYQEGFDCLIVCTGATDPVITEKLYAQLLNGEIDRKVIIDLAIPHNVARPVLKQFDVQYIEIEGLRTLAKENMAFREHEVKEARRVLDDFVAEFPSLHKQRQLELALRRVPTEIKEVKAKAINEVFHKEVNNLDPIARELLERMLTYMEKKCIGIPMKAAREALL